MIYGMKKNGDKYYCDKCGEIMKFEGSCIDKKTETEAIEYIWYKCKNGHEGQIEKEKYGNYL